MNLHLLQLGDSALPIGGYSHSWGLEAAIDRGLVRDAPGLESWVRSWLHEVVGPLEGVVVAAICRALQKKDWSAVRQANDLLQASLTPSTLRSASREMGQQLLALAETWPWAESILGEWLVVSGEWSEARSQADDPREPRLDATTRNSPLATHHSPLPRDHEWHHAVVFATLAAAASATPDEAVAVYLHQVALGTISAGVRAIPIGHTHGQQILARLHDDLNDLARELASRGLETAGSFCPAYEILCHAQTQLYTRLFRS
jgi:urease accessory protein